MRAIILFAALGVAVPAVAQEPVRFERDGVRYEYVVEYSADGARVISGRNLTHNRPFRFEVRGREVTGQVGASEVAFRTRTALAARPTQIASK